jgi:hypothetical protein
MWRGRMILSFSKCAGDVYVSNKEESFYKQKVTCEESFSRGNSTHVILESCLSRAVASPIRTVALPSSVRRGIGDWSPTKDQKKTY